MILEMNGHDFEYKMGAIIRLFYPAIKLEVKKKPKNYAGDCVSVTVETKNAEEFFFCVSANIGKFSGESTKTTTANTQKDKEWVLSRMLYDVLSKSAGKVPSWGALTGVRPVKLVRTLDEEGKSEKEIEEIFESDYLVSSEKISLAQLTYKTQKPILKEITPDTYSLYISIPFCPTRCLYCSFVSHAIENTHKLISEYVELLIRELEYTAVVAKDLGLQLQSVYFGGGTPTQLSAKQLGDLLSAVEKNFDFSYLKEYTVEAGRPDTITKEKLEVISGFGVERISINPQTLNPEVLKFIGRQHTVEEFYSAFELARKKKFAVINTDLIAGLPLEDKESFESGLSEIIKLAPENITIHTLTVKRSSRYAKDEDAFVEPDINLSEVLSSAQEKLIKIGYNPYYLYRQKGTKENQENVGFSLDSAESYYNIGMMEDVQTVLGVGAGATTKLVIPNQKIKRIYNFKYPYEYNSGFQKTIDKKSSIRSLYEKY